jgi:hypothetical protein
MWPATLATTAAHVLRQSTGCPCVWNSCCAMVGDPTQRVPAVLVDSFAAAVLPFTVVRSTIPLCMQIHHLSCHQLSECCSSHRVCLLSAALLPQLHSHYCAAQLWPFVYRSISCIPGEGLLALKSSCTKPDAENRNAGSVGHCFLCGQVFTPHLPIPTCLKKSQETSNKL